MDWLLVIPAALNLFLEVIKGVDILTEFTDHCICENSLKIFCQLLLFILHSLIHFCFRRTLAL